MADKPVKTYRAGTVNVSVWQNEEHHNLTVQKRYKDSDGNWQSSTSFGMKDALALSTLLEKAYWDFGVKED